MPVSALEGKDIIKEWFESQSDIKTILDVGCGVGTYPDLLGKKYTWIGIEVFKPYIEKYKLKDKYDQLIIGDVLEVDLPEADCVIFGDVIEHLERYQAEILMDIARNKYNHIVVSIPLGPWPQGAVNGNVYETHRYEWTSRESELFFNDFHIKKSVGHIGVYIK